MGKNKSIFIEGAIYFFIFGMVFIFSFKSIRGFMYPPEIGKEKIVGFAHYFGYPFYFDTIVFFVFIFSPVIVAFLILLRKKLVKFKRNV